MITAIALTLSIVLVLAGAGAAIVLLRKRFNSQYEALQDNVKKANQEFRTKINFLKDLAGLFLHYERSENLEHWQKTFEENSDRLRSDKGRVTITQAEMEAIDRRLRDLDELKRELEVSAMEAAQELEALKLQEREIGRKTEKLKSQVEKVQGKLDMLISQLENCHSAVERLTSTKKDLIATQEQIEYYESETATLNQSLIQLKRSYDALDIEYAQLYERQNANR